MVICVLELQGELEEKKMELAEAKQKLQAQGSIAAKSESNPICDPGLDHKSSHMDQFFETEIRHHPEAE